MFHSPTYNHPAAFSCMVNWNKSLTMASISFWILTFTMTFAAMSASPVVNPSSSLDVAHHHHRHAELDTNSDITDQAGIRDTDIADDHLQQTLDMELEDDEIFDVDENEFDVDDDDDAFLDDEEIAMEEEMFRKLEGTTIPKRVVKMLRLISEDDEFLDGKGNTVRSYMPVKRKICLGLHEAYVFSMRPMSTPVDPEELKYAELHFYAKNFLANADHEAEEIPISFYYIKADECHPIGVQNLKIPKNGWLVSNVTSLLTHVLIDNTEKVTIAMYIGEGGASQQEDTPRLDSSHEKLVKPFVFVYTEDVATQNGNAQAGWTRLADKLANHETSVSEGVARRRRSVPSANDTNETFDNNEYPLTPVGEPHPATTHTAFSFFAEQNMRRIKSSRRRARNQRKKDSSKNRMLDPVEDDKSSRSRKKKLNKPRPKHLDIVPGADETNSCTRHAMLVDFHATGWTDIIAPTRFEAYYCAGECSYPIPTELHPSNHAVIQGVMHAVGDQPGLPTPCCVPDKMEPVTLLYLDRDSDVALTRFTDMVVRSCRCY